MTIAPSRRIRGGVVGLGLVLLLSACIFLSLALGSVAVPLPAVATILMGGEPPQKSWSTIVLDLRLPRTVTAVFAGAGLSVAGLLMQTMFRNPLAGPYVLGVDAGASLGVAIVTLWLGVGAESFLGSVGLAWGLGRLAAATLGAVATLLLVLAIAARVRNDVTLLVVGLLMGHFTSGLVGILVYMSVPESLQRYLHWTFGSFSLASGAGLILLGFAVTAGLLLAVALAKSMDGLLLGETYASSLGIAVVRVRWLAVLSSSLLAAAVTATCGPISFIGVAVPHLARQLLGTSRHRTLLPACMLIGATLAIAADIIARGTGTEQTLPLNAITALFGAPMLVWLTLRRVEGSV
jgi:iron complex transport system permease protein